MKKDPMYAVSRGLLLGLLVLAGSSGLFGQIAVTMTVNTANPVAGGIPFTYTITATNMGPTGPMTLTDSLPSGIQFVSVSSTATTLAAHVVCSGPPIGTSGSVICTSPSFPAGGVATISLQAQCAPNIQGVRENVADAIPTGPPFPERASFLQTVKNEAFLIFATTATPQAFVGDTIAYNLQVTNGGVSSAFGVLVEDSLPDIVSFVSVTGTGTFHDACSFQPASKKVQCFVNELPTGTGEITIVVKTSDDRKATTSNTATLRANTPLLTNLQATATTAMLRN